MKAYPEYKSSGIDWLGDIPSHWSVSKLKHYISISNGSDPSLEGEIPVYGTGEFPFKTCGEFKVGPTVLLGRKGSIDTPHWVDGKYWNVDTAFDTKVIQNYNMRYFWYFANILDINPYKSTTAVPSMTQSAYDNMFIPIPPIEEQEAIAGYLDNVTAKIDTLMAEKRAQVEDLRKYRTSLITETVTRALNPDAPLRSSGIDWLGDIPEHWIVSPLKYLIAESLMYGANESPEDDINPKNPRYIRITDITGNGALRDETYRTLEYNKAQPYLLKSGDILFARSGATVGKTYRFAESYPCCFAGYLIKATCGDKLDSKFFLYYTNSVCYLNWKNSIFDKSTIQNISAEKYNLLTVPVPPLAEQQAITDFLDDKTAKIDSLIEELESQLNDLSAYKQAVITEAVTGKVDVRDWTPKS